MITARWVKRHPLLFWHASVTTASTLLIGVAWLARDQSGEVDVAVIFAGIPLLLMAFPWSIAFLVGGPFMAMVALAWANVGVHYLLARLLDRRLPGCRSDVGRPGVAGAGRFG